MSDLQDYRNDMMTVADVIDMLKNYDDDTPVVFAYQFGDYLRSMIADNITSAEFHSLGICQHGLKVYTEPDEDEEYLEVLVLSDGDIW